MTKLLVDVGTACEVYHDEHARNLATKRVQWTEFWSFAYSNDKDAYAEARIAGTEGDCWTWTALDADSQLMITWQIGHRDSQTGILSCAISPSVCRAHPAHYDAFAAYRRRV